MIAIVLLSVLLAFEVIALLMVGFFKPPFLKKFFKEEVKSTVAVLPISVAAVLTLAGLAVAVITQKPKEKPVDNGPVATKPTEPEPERLKASEVVVESLKVYVDNSRMYVYEFSTNSKDYDTKIQLLDVSSRIVAEKDIVKIDGVWRIVTKQPQTVAKYFKYTVVDGEELVEHTEAIPLSTNFKDYPKIADSVKITNAKVYKEDEQYKYLLDFSTRSYTTRLIFMGKEEMDNMLERAANFVDDEIVMVTDLMPIHKKLKNGVVSYLTARVYIDGNWYDQTKKIAVASTYQDVDAEMAAAAAEKSRRDSLCTKKITKAKFLIYNQKVDCGDWGYWDYRAYAGKEKRNLK